MALVIEATPGPGPLGVPALSVAHYGEQNGDLMRDPEMCFEVGQPLGLKPNLEPFYFRNDYMGVEQWTRRNDGQQYICHPDLYAQHQQFAALWDKNLRDHGLTLERQLTKTSNIAVTYLNSRGVHQFYTDNLNPFIPDATDPTLGGREPERGQHFSISIRRHLQTKPVDRERQHPQGHKTYAIWLLRAELL